MPLVRVLAGVLEWIVYEALGGLSPAASEAIEDAVVDPLA